MDLEIYRRWYIWETYLQHRDSTAVTHITQRKQQTYLHTKILEAHSTKHCNDWDENQHEEDTVAKKNSLINSYINQTDGTQTYGQDELKMLGYVFSRHPNAAALVEHIKKKFFARLWILRHLARSGASKNDLAKIFQTYIRPVIEYCTNVYHCLLTDEMSDAIENLQCVAMRLIYGRRTSYIRALDQSGLETLETRRHANFKKIAIKTEKKSKIR